MELFCVIYLELFWPVFWTHIFDAKLSHPLFYEAKRDAEMLGYFKFVNVIFANIVFDCAEKNGVLTFRAAGKFGTTRNRLTTVFAVSVIDGIFTF